jgi:chromosome segregation ATPase
VDEKFDVNQLYIEKMRNQEEKIDELKDAIEKVNKKVDDNVSKLNDKIAEVDKKTDNLDNNLSNRLTQIEVKFDMYNDMTSKKLDKLEGKIDNLISFKNNTSSDDAFKSFLLRKGEKLVDVALYGGVLYAIAKGINLI